MIFKLFIISLTTLSVYCQQYPSTLSTTPSPFPPAQVHYVNIGQDLAGDYKFGYDTGKGPTGQSFREETRSADGTVRGAYGYTDAGGQQRIVKYSAGKDGFKIEDDSPAPSSGGSGGSAPAPTPAPYRPPQTLPPQVYRQPQTLPPQVYRPPAPSPQTYRPPSPPAQAYRPPSQPDNSWANLQLNARPVQSYRAPTPAQTLRQLLPQSYSSGSGQALPSLPSYAGNSGQYSGNSGQYTGNSGSSSISFPPSQPTLQTYRAPTQSLPAAPALSQPSLRQYQGLATTPRPDQETWGPPVINTALLSYNIGAQG